MPWGYLVVIVSLTKDNICESACWMVHWAMRSCEYAFWRSCIGPKIVLLDEHLLVVVLQWLLVTCLYQVKCRLEWTWILGMSPLLIWIHILLSWLWIQIFSINETIAARFPCGVDAMLCEPVNHLCKPEHCPDRPLIAALTKCWELAGHPNNPIGDFVHSNWPIPCTYCKCC